MKTFKAKDLRPAVFIDRDGVLNQEIGYITAFDQLKIFPFAKEAIDIIKKCGYQCIVVTNQSAVARGLVSEEAIQGIHQQMQEELFFDAIYYCPHYPPGILEGDAGNPYRTVCMCRKPQPGLIIQAAHEHGIDLAYSFMVGDRRIDIEAGKNAMLKTVLVKTGHVSLTSNLECNQDYTCNDLLMFAKSLLPYLKGIEE